MVLKFTLTLLSFACLFNVYVNTYCRHILYMLITTRVQIIFYVGKGIVIIFAPLSQQLAQSIHLFLKLFHHSPLSYAFNLFRSSSLLIAIQSYITLLMYRDIHLFASVMTIPQSYQLLALVSNFPYILTP